MTKNPGPGRILGAWLLAIALVAAACGSSDSGTDSSGPTGAAGGSEIALLTPDEVCGLVGESDLESALNGTLTAAPDDGNDGNGISESQCTFSDDDGVIVRLTAREYTTDETMSDAAQYAQYLSTLDTATDVPGFDVVATDVGDFAAYGTVGSHEVVVWGAAEDLPAGLEIEIIERWLAATGG